MKAIVYQTYGSPEVLQLKEVATPTPGNKEVLIKVHATSVTAGDWRLRKAEPYITRFMTGLIRPKNPILGHEFSGEVVAVGKGVTRFKKGDEVFGATGLSSGSYAEYIALPEEDPLAHKPANLSHEQAAAVPVGALTALYFLKQANIQPGQKVLIYGASGSVGSFAVQLARHFGAHVTGVCSTKNVAMVKALGADQVIDYTLEDFTQNEAAFLSTEFEPAIFLAMLLPFLAGGKKVFTGVTKQSPKDLEFLATLIEAEALRPVIDRSYPFEATAEAHAYVEQGHKKGNVVISLEHVFPQA